jgi:hypothetical protein
MGFITGLKEINAVMDRPKATENYQKTRWLQLSDGQSVKVRFPNELDEDSPNFDPERGLALVAAEHTNPKDYKKKALCTMDDDGRCFGCEMHQRENGNKDYKGQWRARLRFYTNVLVLDDGDLYVAVWSQGVSNKSAFNILREQAMETGSVSNVTWKMKRNGSGTETSYVLIPSAPDTEPYDWTGVELFNLEKVVRQVPYAEQEAFYLGFEANAAATSTIDW